MKKITSFTVDHDYIVPGVYISRIDGEITTYDLRTRRPNCGDLMDHGTMHTAEHMLATYIRNSRLADSIIYFGPMGCQTGFYLLVRNADHSEVLDVLRESHRPHGACVRRVPQGVRQLRLARSQKGAGRVRALS